jgi:oxygen-dependent protoporphyrinogen oxidase
VLSDGGSEAASQVVLALPARPAASLVQALLPNASAELARAKLLSNVSVNLRYDAAQFRDYPRGSGLIFPERFAPLGLRALSLVDHKFAGRVTDGHALLRVFFRPTAASEGFDEPRFVTEAARAIASVLSVSGEPAEAWVSRWDDALPVYTPEFRQSVAMADEELRALGIHLAGSAFHGAGIDAAVASAERVAARLGS